MWRRSRHWKWLSHLIWSFSSSNNGDLCHSSNLIIKVPSRQSTFALISRSHAFAHGSEFSQRPIRWTKLESDVWRKWSIRSSSLHYVTLFCSAVHYVRSGEWCVTHVGHYKQQEVGKWPNWKAQGGWLTWTWSPGLIIDLSFAKIQRELKRDCKKTIRALVYKLLTLLIMLTLL